MAQVAGPQAWQELERRTRWRWVPSPVISSRWNTRRLWGFLMSAYRRFRVRTHAPLVVDPSFPVPIVCVACNPRFLFLESMLLLPAATAATTQPAAGTNSFEGGHRSGSDGCEESKTAAPSGACLLNGVDSGTLPSCMPRAPLVPILYPRLYRLFPILFPVRNYPGWPSPSGGALQRAPWPSHTWYQALARLFWVVSLACT